jgi:hypothetical protein
MKNHGVRHRTLECRVHGKAGGRHVRDLRTRSNSHSSKPIHSKFVSRMNKELCSVKTYVVREFSYRIFRLLSAKDVLGIRIVEVVETAVRAQFLAVLTTVLLEQRKSVIRLTGVALPKWDHNPTRPNEAFRRRSRLRWRLCVCRVHATVSQFSMDARLEADEGIRVECIGGVSELFGQRPTCGGQVRRGETQTPKRYPEEHPDEELPSTANDPHRAPPLRP